VINTVERHFLQHACDLANVDEGDLLPRHARGLARCMQPALRHDSAIGEHLRPLKHAKQLLQHYAVERRHNALYGQLERQAVELFHR
jgi:hypothetical protein